MKDRKLKLIFLNTICFILLTLFVICDALPQATKLYSVDKELASSMVHDVYQDHHGMIWFATENGINRYDGSKFVTYKKDKKDKNTLLNNFTKIFYQDRDNEFLVGYVNGLQIYDYASDSFTEVPLLLEDGEPFPANVSTIMQCENGDVLVGTSGQGIFQLTHNNNSLVARQKVNFFPSKFISQLFEDKDLNLWAVTQDQGVFKVTIQGKTYHYPIGKDIPGSSVSSIYQDSQGNIYAGTTSGLYEYDRINEGFAAVQNTRIMSLTINKIYENTNGEIMLGTEGDGLKIYDPVNKNISEGNYRISTFDISKSKVNSIMQDNAKNIWLSVYQKGVILLPAIGSNFEYIGYKSIRNNTIGSNAVTSVYRDFNNFLWVGTDGDGLFKLGSNHQVELHFNSEMQDDNFPATVMDIFEDSHHSLWIGSYDNGLFKINDETGKFQNMNFLFRDSTAQIPRIFDIIEDEHNTLWIATMGLGLYSVDLSTYEVRHFKSDKDLFYDFKHNNIHTSWLTNLLITSDNKLFIGTADGIGCMDLSNFSFVNTYGVNRLLSGDIIYSLYEDKNKTIWIGTSEGLKYKKQNEDSIYVYEGNEGLSKNSICSILEDKQNNLWVSTSYGITKINLTNKNHISYYANDGLQGNEFNKRAAYADKNGQLIFGGMNGITLFYPEGIIDESRDLNVHLTGFYIHDKLVRKGMKSGSYDIISKAVIEENTFHLSQKDNSFTVEFSAMEYGNPDRISYMYNLGDEKWNTLRPGTNNITFSNLAPDKYSLKIRAKNYNTISDVREISIIVHPAWYLSVWAKLIYLLFIVMIVSFVIYYIYQRRQTHKKMQEHIQAKKIIDAKLQLFINIAHEIRTPLSLIISPLKKLLARDNDPTRQKSYATMSRNGDRILHMVNQLMDVQKIDKGQLSLHFQEIEIVGYINNLCGIFEEQLKMKNVEFEFRNAVEKLLLWIDPDNFDKVILNVLANAIKFTPENGRIHVTISSVKRESTSDGFSDFAQIVISDSGIGIPDDELDKVFDYFYQVKDGKHKSFDGTGIGLHLSRSIVELHHGVIKAENNISNPGCQFIIHLPLGNKHLKESEIQITPVRKKITEQPMAIPVVQYNQHEITIKSRSKNRILVVDDDEDILEYITRELAFAYHVAQCSNGKEALSYILKNTPDLIISDVMMPEMDGITLCRKIKQNTNINHIPIILLTAKANEEDNLEGLGIGADAYMVKPFNVEILKKTVENIIRNRQMLRNNFTGSQEQKDKVKDITMKSPDEKLLFKVIDIVNENLNNPELNVEMLAHEIGISRVHLHRKLKELTSQSTRDFIRNIRLNQAANLLSDKHMNISEVAFAVGFINVAHFSNAFKEFYGESPTSYMEAHLKQLD